MARPYSLEVRYTGCHRPREVHEIAVAVDVLGAISLLLQAHPGCEQIDVRLDGMLMFSVDRSGATLSPTR